ncbi:MAG: PhzF family phenazine biosynthesis protein [Pseudomonadota bacterium]
MSSPQFDIVDVFVSAGGGGNPLAVVYLEEALCQAEMQRIAREFNFSETTFVSGTSDAAADFTVKIFTPCKEVPFAGHPNIGTAFALYQRGLLADKQRVTFDERAGLVPITLAHGDPEGSHFELRAPETLTLGDEVTAEEIAAILSLEHHQISTRRHVPMVASVGLPFLIVELSDLDALSAVDIDVRALRALDARGVTADIHCYCRTGESNRVQARMFAPLDGVPEDPATGSANCALAGLLAHVDEQAEGSWCFEIHQGIEMGRASRLDARVVSEGDNTEIFIGGRCRSFAEGRLHW